MTDILAVDIGGTHSRFGHFRLDRARALVRLNTCWLRTADADSFPRLMAKIKSADFSLATADAVIAVVAVAGPVESGRRCSPPNIPWDIDLSRDDTSTLFKRCVLINDFIAQAYGCLTAAADSALPVLGGAAQEGGTIGVLGAGTGLGHAAIAFCEKGGVHVIGSEGGHAGFAFESGEEWEYRQYLQRLTGEPYVRAETVLSGSGLSRLHHFLTGERLDPEAVSAGFEEDSRTLAWTARFYGRQARHYALQVLATGGLYIAGGIAARIPALVTHPEFAAEFRRTATMSQVLDRIPVFLVTDEESGLWGAARFGAEALAREPDG